MWSHLTSHSARSKNRDPQFPDTHTGILVGDGIKQILLKIHLRRLKEYHFVSLRKAPDIRHLQLQKSAGICHQTALSILAAQGAGQCHRHYGAVPLAWRKLPDKLISIA